MIDSTLRAIAEPRRREILRLVQGRERSSGEIAAHFDVTRPAISQHLAVLAAAGLVSVRRQGTRRLYRARRDRLAELRKFLDEFWDERLQALAQAAETEERRSPHGRARSDDSVEREVRISARPETVFPFFTEAQKMERWMGVSCDLDPRPGGVYGVNVTGRDIARGEYLEVVPYSRVVFTWGWEGESSDVPPGSSTVEISLTPDADGTIVRLRHLGLPTEQRDGHGEGWDHYLLRLVTAAQGGDPGPDSWAASATDGERTPIQT